MRAATPRLLFLLAASLTFLISWSAFAQETPTPELTLTPTNTDTPLVVPTETATLLPPPLPPTEPPTATQTETPTIPPPPTPSETATADLTPNPSPTGEGLTETPTNTATSSPTFDPLATLTETLTATMTGTASATASATETETGTLTPTVTATETASATPTGIPGLTLISFTDVEQLHVADWLDDGTWTPIWNEQGKMLEILPIPLPGYFIYPGLSDVAVQARFFAPNGALSLTVRDSGTDNYTATVYPTTGQVQLLRNRTLIQAVTLNITPGAWHTFQLSAVGSLIKVTLDGSDVILFSDTQPLAAGMVGLMNADSAQSLLVDDLAVWAGGIAVGALDMSMSEMEMSVQSVTPTPLPPPPLPGRVGWLRQISSTDRRYYVREPNGTTRQLSVPNPQMVAFSPTGDRVAYNYDGALDQAAVPNDGRPGNYNQFRNLFGYPMWTGTECPMWSSSETYLLARLRGTGGTLPENRPNITGAGLYLITPRNPGDTQPAVLTPVVVGLNSFCGVWSPTQDRFVTIRRENNANDLWLYDVNNLSNPVRLTDNLRPESYITWSPDGTRIAYVAPENGSNNLYVIDLNQPGSLPHIDPEALRGTEANESEPTWSPDGSRIAYIHAAQFGTPGTWNGVWIVELASPGAAGRIPGGSTGDSDPQWSPDNRWLALKRSLTFYSMVDVITGQAHPITDSVAGAGIFEVTWANVPPPVLAGTLVAPTRTSTPTVTPLPTNTPLPTPTPTATPSPTPSPTPTATQRPEPNLIAVNTYSQVAQSESDCTLTDAIIAANTDTTVRGCVAVPSSAPDTITVPNGDYVLTAAYEGEKGLPTITAAMSIIVAGEATVRRSSESQTFRLLTIGISGDLTVENITMQDGFVTGNGGGIYNEGNLTLRFSTVRDNRAGMSGLRNSEGVFEISASNGGGIYNLGNLQIENSNIFKNRTDIAGGGIYNAGTMIITASRVERNVAVNVVVDARHEDYLSNLVPPGRQNSVGGGIFHSGNGSGQITASCIALNTSRNGGGIFSTGESGFSANGNWWGLPEGPSFVVLDGTEGFWGDVVTGSSISASDSLLFPPTLATPTLSNYSQNCYQIDTSLYNSDTKDRWGRPDLALEVYIRTSDLIGREIELGEVLGLGIYVASNQGENFDERDLNMFAEAIGRIYHEYNKIDRGEGAPVCPPIFSQTQQLYLSRTEFGLLCTLGTLSEWYGEVSSAEYQSLFVADFVRLGILDRITAGDGTISWHDRGNWVNQPNDRVLGRPQVPDRPFEECRNWEVGLNREGGIPHDPTIDVQGCPWVWGNETKLYENDWAETRLENSQIAEIPISPTNNVIIEVDSGPGYIPTEGNPYVTNPDSFIRFSAISLILEQQNPFYMFTIIQNNVLKCNAPLQAIEDSGYAAGYYPACLGESP